MTREIDADVARPYDGAFRPQATSMLTIKRQILFPSQVLFVRLDSVSVELSVANRLNMDISQSNRA